MTTFPVHLSRSGAVSGATPRDGADAEWNGVLYTAQTAHGACAELARKLVDAGCPDQPVEVYLRGGTRSMSCKSLHGLAKTTLTEGDKTRIKRIKYVANPMFAKGEANAA
jgi:hypothetical protein